MKKILCLLLVIAMALSFVSCGKDETADDGVVTIKWLVPGDKQPETALIMEEFNKVSVEKIGVKLDLQFLDQSAYEEKVKMMMAAKQEMDLLFAGYIVKPHEVVNLGGLYDITDLLPKVTPKLYNELIPEYVWTACKNNGRIYSVPNLQILCQNGAFAVDVELAKKYNFDYKSVKKPEDLEPFLELVKQNEPDRIPARGYLYAFDDNLYEYNYEHVVCWDKEAGKMVIEASRPSRLEHYKNANRWYKNGYLRKDIATNTDDVAFYKAGKFAVLNVQWTPNTNTDIMNQTGKAYDTVMIADPYMSTPTVIATQIAVSATTKYPEECLKMIELINEDVELYNLICYGIEGKHYTFDGNDRLVLKDESGYRPNASWKFGNNMNSYLLPTDAEDVWEMTKKYNDECVKSPLLGYVFKPDAVKTEIIQCKNAADQYAVDITIDDIDGQFNKLVEEVMKAGAEKVLADYQKQADDYINSQK